eukprot:767382-Hanusia_phi.AAC.5
MLNRIEIDLRSCPEEDSILVAGTPLDPQPNVLAVYDTQNEVAVTNGNEAFAEIYMKPTSYGVSKLICTDNSLVKQDACFPYNGYAVFNGTTPFLEADGTAAFAGLSIASTNVIESSDRTLSNRKFFLRILARGWQCFDNGLCGFYGKIVYSDCPFGFYVKANVPSRIELVVQPGNGTAGRVLTRQPVLQIVDEFGNAIQELLEALTVTTSLVTDNVLAFQYGNISYDVSANMVFNTTSTWIAFGSQNVSAIALSQAGRGYSLAFKLSNNDTTLFSDSFDVENCRVSKVAIKPEFVLVAAGDSICGSGGSAWDEIDKIKKVISSCSCQLGRDGNYSFKTTLESSQCNVLCKDVFGGSEGIFAQLDLEGDQRTGVRSRTANFYVGSTIQLWRDGYPIPLSTSGDCSWSMGCEMYGNISDFDVEKHTVNVSLHLASDYSGNLALAAPAEGRMYRIVLDKDRIFQQSHRCIVVLEDEFGNLAANEDFFVRVSFTVSGLPVDPSFFRGQTSYRTVAGLGAMGNMSLTKSGHYKMRLELLGAVNLGNSSSTSMIFTEIDVMVVHNIRKKVLFKDQLHPLALVGSPLPIQPIIEVTDEFDNPIINTTCNQVYVSLSLSRLILYNNVGINVDLIGDNANLQQTTCEMLNINVTSSNSSLVEVCAIAFLLHNGRVLLQGVGTTAKLSTQNLFLEARSGCDGCHSNTSQLCQCSEPRVRGSDLSQLLPQQSSCINNLSNQFATTLPLSNLSFAGSQPDVFTSRVLAGTPFSVSAILQDKFGAPLKLNQDEVSLRLQSRVCNASGECSPFEDEEFEAGVCRDNVISGQTCVTGSAAFCQISQSPVQSSVPCESFACGAGFCDTNWTSVPQNGVVTYSGISIYRASGEKLRQGGAYSMCQLTTFQPWCVDSHSFEMLQNIPTYRFAFYAVSDMSIKVFSDPFVIASANVISRLAILSQPFNAVAGADLGRIIIELRDAFDNLVTQTAMLRIQVQSSPVQQAHGYQCAGQVCTESDNIFCSNSATAQDKASCEAVCYQTQGCVGYTYYQQISTCQSMYGTTCSKKFSCYLAFDSCAPTEDLEGGSVTFLGSLMGVKETQTSRGVGVFSGLSYNFSGNLSLKVCLANPCSVNALTEPIKIISGNISNIELLSPNTFLFDMFTMSGYVPSDAIINEKFSINVVVLDEFGNLILEPTWLYVSINQSTSDSYIIGDSVSNFTTGLVSISVGIAGPPATYALRFAAVREMNASNFSSESLWRGDLHSDIAYARAISPPFEVSSPAVSCRVIVWPTKFVVFDILYPFPIIALYDQSSHVAVRSKLRVTASIPSDQGTLLGAIQVSAQQGYANFTSMTVSREGLPVVDYVSTSFTFIVSNEIGQTFSCPADFASTGVVTQVYLPKSDQTFFSVASVLPSSAIAGGLLPLVRVTLVSENLYRYSGRYARVFVQNVTECSPYSHFCQDSRGVAIEGQTEVFMWNGTATFTDLRITTSGVFSLRFETDIFGHDISHFASKQLLSVDDAGLSTVSIFQQPTTGTAGIGMTPGFVLTLNDRFGNLHTNTSLTLEANIGQNSVPAGISCWNYLSEFQLPTSLERPSTLCGQLIRSGGQDVSVGSNTITSKDGIAAFECIAIDLAKAGYTLLFAVLNVDIKWTIETQKFQIISGEPSEIVTVMQPSVSPQVTVGVAFKELRTPRIVIVDRYKNQVSAGLNAFVKASLDISSATTIGGSHFPIKTFNSSKFLLQGVLNLSVVSSLVDFPDIYVIASVANIRIRYDVAGLVGYSNYFTVVSSPYAVALKSLVQPATCIQDEMMPAVPAVVLLDGFENEIMEVDYLVSLSVVSFQSDSHSLKECEEVLGTAQTLTVKGRGDFPGIIISANPGSYKLRYDIGGLVNSLRFTGIFSSNDPSKHALKKPLFSDPFDVLPKGAYLRFFPHGWTLCTNISDAITCNVQCKWIEERKECVGFEDAVVGDALVQQPRISIFNAMDELLQQFNGHQVRASLVSNNINVTGWLSGNRTVTFVNGTAYFTDLAISRVSQGISLMFDLVIVDSDQTFMKVQSPYFNVYSPIAQINITEHPQDRMIGSNAPSRSVQVVLLDSETNIAAYSTGFVSVELIGSKYPRCPPGTKTLPLPTDKIQAIWLKYSMAITDVFQFNPTAFVDGVNTIDINEFALLLQTEFSVQVDTATVLSIFQRFDLGGQLSAEGIVIPDNVLSKDEFLMATSMCLCNVGFGAGIINLNWDALTANMEYQIVPKDSCFALLTCDPGFLGKACRMANSKVTRDLPRLSLLQGQTKAPIVYGKATFTDLQVLEAGTNMSLNFSTHGIWIESKKFSIFPGVPSKAIFLAPTNGSTLRAGLIPDMKVVLVDMFENVQLRGTGFVYLEHLDVLKFSSDCTNSSQVLPCNSCPDTDGDVCPGPRCPFRCDYSNAIRPSSYQDPNPWGQVCSYNCKQGCTFLCGTINNISIRGQHSFADVQIKRTGEHRFHTRLVAPSIDMRLQPDSSAEFQLKQIGTVLRL